MAKATHEKTVIINDPETFEAWLVSLRDTRASQIVRRRLARLASGNLGDCAPVGDGVHEVRIKHGPGLRVYFANQDEKIVIILGGGSKRRQQADIKRAKQIWQGIENERANEENGNA